jgi:hypothetical protein
MGLLILAMDQPNELNIRLRNTGSSEPTKLLHHFESDQVHDFWLI